MFKLFRTKIAPETLAATALRSENIRIRVTRQEISVLFAAELGYRGRPARSV